MTTQPALWQCPVCERRFANRNQSHACGRHDLEHHFAGKPPEGRALFDAFVAELRALGPVTVLPEKTRIAFQVRMSLLPEKTRIAFQVRMSFAQLTPRRRWIDGHVVLARRLESPRFRSVQTFSPRNHLHTFRLATLADVDDELRAWLAEAYRVGEQRHLDPAPA